MFLCLHLQIISVHVSVIIHEDTFHESKWDFSVYCTATSFKIRNHYIVVNLIVVADSAENCCGSSMKHWVLKKVVLFIVYRLNSWFTVLRSYHGAIQYILRSLNYTKYSICILMQTNSIHETCISTMTRMEAVMQWTYWTDS